MLQVKYQVLSAMGITYWQPRSQLLVSDKPLFCAACLVLLPEKLLRPAAKQQDILDGMLQVLTLSEAEICVAWFNTSLKFEERDWAAIVAEIIKWAPHSLLIMGDAFAKKLLQVRQLIEKVPIKIQVTYSPAELEKTKELKRKAYEDLLQLKKYLNTVSAV